jgi:hypothetical protein
MYQNDASWAKHIIGQHKKTGEPGTCNGRGGGFVGCPLFWLAFCAEGMLNFEVAPLLSVLRERRVSRHHKRSEWTLHPSHTTRESYCIRPAKARTSFGDITLSHTHNTHNIHTTHTTYTQHTQHTQHTHTTYTTHTSQIDHDTTPAAVALVSASPANPVHSVFCLEHTAYAYAYA